MVSTLLMKFLITVYLIICIVCLFEKNYAKALYWFSAGLINVSVMWGMK